MSLMGEDREFRTVRVADDVTGRGARVCGHERVLPHRSVSCAGPPDAEATYVCTLPPHGDRAAHVMVPYVHGGVLYRLADDNVVRVAPDGSTYRSSPGQPFRARVPGDAGQRRPLVELLGRGTSRVVLGVDPASPGAVSAVEVGPGEVAARLLGESPAYAAFVRKFVDPGQHDVESRVARAREEGRTEGRDEARRFLLSTLAQVRKRFGSLFAAERVSDDEAQRDREYAAREVAEAGRPLSEQVWNLAQGAAVHAEAQVFEALGTHARSHGVAAPSGSVGARVAQVVRAVTADDRTRGVEQMHVVIDRAFARAGVRAENVRTRSTAARLDHLVRVGEARAQHAGQEGMIARSLASLARRAVPGRDWDDEPAQRMVEAIEARLRRTAHVDRAPAPGAPLSPRQAVEAYTALRDGLAAIFYHATPSMSDVALLGCARTAYRNAILLAGRVADPTAHEGVPLYADVCTWLDEARAVAREHGGTGDAALLGDELRTIIARRDEHGAPGPDYVRLRRGLVDALGHEGPAEDALLLDKVRTGRHNLVFLLTRPGQLLAMEDRPGDVEQAVADSPLTHHYRERMRAVLVALAESGTDGCLRMSTPGMSITGAPVDGSDGEPVLCEHVERGPGTVIRFEEVSEVALPLALDRAVARAIERAGQGQRAHARAERYRDRLSAIRARLDQLPGDVREFVRDNGRIDLQVSRALDYLCDVAGQARPQAPRPGDRCSTCGDRLVARVADGADWSSPSVPGVVVCPGGCTDRPPADSLLRMARLIGSVSGRANLSTQQLVPDPAHPSPDPEHWTNGLLYGAPPLRSLTDLVSMMPEQSPDEALRALRRFTVGMAQAFGSPEVVVGQALLNASDVAGLPWCTVLARRSPQGQVRDVAVAVREPGAGFGRPGEPSQRWWTAQRGEMLTSGELFEHALPLRWVVVAAPTVEWPGRERG